MAALDKEKVLLTVQESIVANCDPLELIEEARQGLELVGEKFDRGSYYLMELMWAAQIFEEAAALISPQIAERYGSTTTRGTVLMGTVKGDIHDLGKGIVSRLLECSGFEVIDLGVDVPPEIFVSKIREHRPQVLGMSALLTAAIGELNRAVSAVEEAGLRETIKIIVGGGIVGEVKRKAINVDYATTNARQGVRVIEGWIEAGSRRCHDRDTE
jgi:methanogenic corrinoid protein MtbC1